MALGHTRPVQLWKASIAISVQAIEELNIKQKYWKDLLSDESFTRKDIIHLQDPLNLSVSLRSWIFT